MNDPQITIVIPLYNRARFIARTLDSCLAQSCRDFKIIVVDDGSTDGSADIVRGYSDPRITLLIQPRNRGVGPARNRGADAADTEWLVFLDSDDELLPDAVAVMLAKSQAADSSVSAFFFRCRLDDGSISPTTMPPYGKISYVDYLEHINACAGKKRDSLWCRRRATFATVRYPDSYGLEDRYHLDFNRDFRAVACEETVRLYHQDADDQLSRKAASRSSAKDLLFGRDRAATLREAIEGHGEALSAHAPLLLREFIGRLIVLQTSFGSRRDCLETLALARKWKMTTPAHLALVGLAMISPRLIAVIRKMLPRGLIKKLRGT